MSDEPAAAAPASPYRGIQPFRYADHAVFFAREEESRLLCSLVAVYRGVFLYGDSGNGKSSLVNAGLVPQALELGFEPVRVRVQPRRGEELVVERITVSDDGDDDALPLVLADETDGAAARVVLSIADFEARVRAVSARRRPLIVFDQFEEILTLFEDGPAVASRLELAEMIVRLLGDPLRVKLLFAFREDYLGRVKQLLAARPGLVDQALRLGPPSADALDAIIRGPFERFPGHYARELGPALAQRLRTALDERFGSGDVSLSEVQTVCLRLWRSPDPDALLAEKGVQGLLEDELGEALDGFAPDLRGAAVALLSQMVTSAGTRNVISAEDLRLRVREEDAGIAPALLDEALDRLERESKLVRRERRRDLYLYEITSEFLVPWISRRRDELHHARERRRDRRRLRVLGGVAAVLVVVAGAVAALAIWALGQRSDAQHREAEATSLGLAAAASAEPVRSRPDHALALALEAYRSSPLPEASAAVVRALQAARRAGLRGILSGHTQAVENVAYSPDGTLLATASSARDSVRLWDARTGSLRGILRTKDFAGVIEFSPDSKTLATANTSVHLWDARTRASRGRFGRYPTYVNALAFSPDGKTLAVTSASSDVGLWDPATRTHRGRLHGHRGPVYGVAYSADGSSIATAGSDGTVRIWDRATSAERDRLRMPTEAFDIALSRDGTTLVTLSNEDNALRRWSVRTHKQLPLPRLGEILVFALSSDERTLAAASFDGTVHLLDPARRIERGRLASRALRQVQGLAFSPDGKTLAAGGVLPFVALWDPAAPGLDKPLGGGAAPPFAIGRDGTLAVAGRRGTVRLLDPDTRAERGHLAGHAEAITTLAFSPDGKTIASGDYSQGHRAPYRYDGALRLSDPRTGKQVRVLDRHYATAAIAFSPDGRTLAAAGADGTARLYDPIHGTVRGTLGRGFDPILALAFSPDGATLATASANQTVTLWNPRTRKQRTSFEVGRDLLPGIAFSPDGTLLAVSSTDGSVVLWNTATRKAAGRLVGTAKSVYGIAFSRDGKTLATASSDGSARLWDVATRKPRGRVAAHDGEVLAVGFARDDTTLVTATRTRVRLWRDVLWRDARQLRGIVCGQLRTWPTRSEWTRYASGIPFRRSCP